MDKWSKLKKVIDEHLEYYENLEFTAPFLMVKYNKLKDVKRWMEEIECKKKKKKKR